MLSEKGTTIKPKKNKTKQNPKSNDFSLEGSPSTYRKEPELKGPQEHVGRPCGFQGKAKKKKKKFRVVS